MTTGTVIDVVAPINEEGTRATLLKWSKNVGDQVRKDEPLLELETEKVTVEIPSPASGELMEILQTPGHEVRPGQPLARLRVAIDDSERTRAEDVLQRPALAPGNSRIPHTAMRRRIAEHMVRSLAQAPHVTTLFEADLSSVLAHRTDHAGEFERRGARLTLTAYFIVACAAALRAHPQLNATFEEEALELHADVDIGIATALGRDGVIVPVIRRAQYLDLFGIASRLGELVSAARGGTLTPAEVRGGTFTISNHGVGGSLLAVPVVINQPQVAVLGIGKAERRVRASQTGDGESIEVRSMCYVTLTIDHRALDAFQANAFLSAVARTLEHWPAE